MSINYLHSHERVDFSARRSEKNLIVQGLRLIVDEDEQLQVRRVFAENEISKDGKIPSEFVFTGTDGPLVINGLTKCIEELRGRSIFRTQNRGRGGYAESLIDYIQEHSSPELSGEVADGNLNQPPRFGDNSWTE